MQLLARGLRPAARHLFVQHYKRLGLQTFKEREGDASQLNRSGDNLWPTTEADDRKLPIYAPSKFYGQAERAISTGKLHALRRFHFQPIKHVVYVCPS